MLLTSFNHSAGMYLVFLCQSHQSNKRVKLLRKLTMNGHSCESATSNINRSQHDVSWFLCSIIRHCLTLLRSIAMSSPQLQQRPSGSASLQGDFRVEVLGTQESLDLDCGKFYTVRTRLRRHMWLDSSDKSALACGHRNTFCAARGSKAIRRQRSMNHS